jgi:hypothetical protein
MLAAPTEADFLSFVPRRMLLASSEEYASVQNCLAVMKSPNRHYNCVPSVETQQLDSDAARILNQQAPLSVWLASARSTSLSSQLRMSIAVEGWTRAILLGDREKAVSFLPLLPEALREQAGQSSALAPWITLAKNPGLRPYVNAGTQRAYSYDFVEDYRDNWCYRPEDYAEPFIPSAFLSQAESQQGTDEARRLAPIRSVVVGQRIIRSVQANVKDPRAAEELYLTLRMIRYGCTAPAQSNPGSGESGDSTYPSVAIPYSRESDDLLRLKQDAARLLRHYYPASPWTKKAAPFAG